MSASPARRPSIRLNPIRRPREADLDAHRPIRWLPVKPGQTVTVVVGYGLSVDPADSRPLARHLRPAKAIRIAARTDAAGRTARILLTALWRAEDRGAS